VLRWVALGAAVLLLVGVVGGYLVYRHLERNIATISETGLGHRPAKVVKQHVDQQPLNILLLGSDTRDGQTGHIGGATPGLSDTTIVLHLSADRQHAYAVSIPRDSMVQMPSCPRKDGSGTFAGGLMMFNEAYAIGGPVCTVKTVEQLTHIRMDHFVVVDFNGFRRIVDALDGVEVCVPEPVHDPIGHIDLPGGTYTVKGDQALDYVRIRHVISDNGDIGRMARQQAFLASMTNKAVSLGTLTNPVRLYQFLDAVTSAISADEGLASLQDLMSLGRQLRNIGLDHVRFLTVPFEAYPPNPNRLQWAQPEADRLWRRLNHDLPLDSRQRAESTSAQQPTPAGPGTGSPSASPGGAATGSTSAEEQATARAAANGLCS
jgi:LCP family protein required for cell wall assembly